MEKLPQKGIIWPILTPYNLQAPTKKILVYLRSKAMKPSLCLFLSPSRTGKPMKRRSKARSEAKSLLGSGFKAKSLPGSGSESGSGHRKNPAQLQKLRDEKKQAKAVQDSPRPHSLAEEEEKAADPYCECCEGAAGSHYSAFCPYLRWLPWDVDTVGKGFVIMCKLCSGIGDDCMHQLKRAFPLMCDTCGVDGHHFDGDCWEKDNIREYGRKITLGRRPDTNRPGWFRM